MRNQLLKFLVSLLILIDNCLAAVLPETLRRELKWGQVNILHTTDMHGWLAGHAHDKRYSADLGEFVSFIHRMKQLAQEKDVDLLVIDTGDLHDGTGLSDLTDPPGSWTNDLLTNVPYDLLVAGNHELYLPIVMNDTYHNFIPFWNGRYLASNVDIYDEEAGMYASFGEKYAVFETPHNVRILSLGFVGSFSGGSDKARVLSMEASLRQPWWNELQELKDIDLILIAGHFPVHDSSELDLLLLKLRKEFPDTIIQVLGGHSHIRDYAVYDEKATGLQSGRYCETAGWASIRGVPSFTSSKVNPISSYSVFSLFSPLINYPRKILEASYIFTNPSKFSRSYIDWNRKGFVFHSKVHESKFDTSEGLELSHQIADARRRLNLLDPLGCSPKDYGFSEVPRNASNSIYNLFESEIFPKIIVNKSRSHMPHYIILNTGGIRGGLQQGSFGLDELFQVSPFKGNVFYVLKSIPWFIVKDLPYWLEHSGYLSIFDKSSTLPGDSNTVTETLTYTKSEPKKVSYGYWTHDDMGDDGDDTIHLPVPHYDSGNYLCSKVNIHLDIEHYPQRVDLVTTEFVIPRLNYILNKLVGKALYTKEDWELYFWREDGRHSMTDLLALYADKYWDKECFSST
ncbi:phosphoprotein phosphatase [Schizosaccharomyces cryophilus OY26]|uniref:Phosphoprotein phosphatase n=1 Tax=Schizosaccharomyces cryophilus (strain OY26 / ATCC MYA-4695 / CBS 11777 / NBRC 106824 / NRRL Y48691) TaxID=653667 RepID=S9XGG4_SCHCR|nr:phosphoprotein phosphatase [Schizosaccharomyces cryophilus OY26]EPY52776.1 phosphoprotein phosphatase [Schizosaccharomyces cryophilus OY26]